LIEIQGHCKQLKSIGSEAYCEKDETTDTLDTQSHDRQKLGHTEERQTSYSLGVIISKKIKETLQSIASEYYCLINETAADTQRNDRQDIVFNTKHPHCAGGSR
jgi:hypothetical protein